MKAKIIPVTGERGTGYRVAEEHTMEHKTWFSTKFIEGYAIDYKGTWFDTIEQALAYCTANNYEIEEHMCI